MLYTYNLYNIVQQLYFNLRKELKGNPNAYTHNLPPPEVPVGITAFQRLFAWIKDALPVAPIPKSSS